MFVCYDKQVKMSISFHLVRLKAVDSNWKICGIPHFQSKASIKMPNLQLMPTSSSPQPLQRLGVISKRKMTDFSRSEMLVKLDVSLAMRSICVGY